MNYLAHAYRHLADPIFALGTQVPDFLNMVDRRARARSKHAALHLESSDHFLSRLAAGVMQHHRDDQAFHGSPEFLSLQEKLSAQLRLHFPDARGMRSWFTAHIAIEMLLDWTIHSQTEHLLDDLYSIYRQSNVPQFQQAVEVLTGRTLPTFSKQHAFFLSERFLYDYGTDASLAYRINRVLQRVGLESFEAAELSWLPVARQWVWDRRQVLVPCLPTGH